MSRNMDENCVILTHLGGKNGTDTVFAPFCVIVYAVFMTYNCIDINYI